MPKNRGIIKYLQERKEQEDEIKDEGDSTTLLNLLTASDSVGITDKVGVARKVRAPYVYAGRIKRRVNAKFSGSTFR